MNSSSKILHSVQVEVNPTTIKSTFQNKIHKKINLQNYLNQKRKKFQTTKFSPFKLNNRIPLKININKFSVNKPHLLNFSIKKDNEDTNLNIMGNSLSTRNFIPRKGIEENSEKKFLTSFSKNFNQKKLEQNPPIPKSAGREILHKNFQESKNQEKIRKENYQYESILNYPFLSLYEKIRLSGLLSSRQIIKPENTIKIQKERTTFSGRQPKMDNSKNILNYEPLFSITSYTFESNSQKERCRKIASILQRMKLQIQNMEKESDIFNFVLSFIGQYLDVQMISRIGVNNFINFLRSNFRINPKLNMKELIQSICINQENLNSLRFSEQSNNSVFYPSKVKTSYLKTRKQNFNNLLNYGGKEKSSVPGFEDMSQLTKLSGDSSNLGKLLDNYLSKKKIIIHSKNKIRNNNIIMRSKESNYLDANRILLEKIMIRRLKLKEYKSKNIQKMIVKDQEINL